MTKLAATPPAAEVASICSTSYEGDSEHRGHRSLRN